MLFLGIIPSIADFYTVFPQALDNDLTTDTEALRNFFRRVHLGIHQNNLCGIQLVPRAEFARWGLVFDYLLIVVRRSYLYAVSPQYPAYSNSMASIFLTEFDRRFASLVFYDEHFYFF